MLYSLDDTRPEISADGCFVAPDAAVIGKVRLARRASVWFGAVLRGDNELIDVGEASNIQDGSICHTDMGAPLTIGANVTVGHKVVLHGCTIGEGSLIGIGSIILNHAKIGAMSIVGANSLITERKEFPPGILLMGAPAKVVRPLNEHEKQMLLASATHYADNASRYAAQLNAI